MLVPPGRLSIMSACRELGHLRSHRRAVMSSVPRADGDDHAHGACGVGLRDGHVRDGCAQHDQRHHGGAPRHPTVHHLSLPTRAEAVSSQHARPPPTCAFRRVDAGTFGVLRRAPRPSRSLLWIAVAAGCARSRRQLHAISRGVATGRRCRPSSLRHSRHAAFRDRRHVRVARERSFGRPRCAQPPGFRVRAHDRHRPEGIATWPATPSSPRAQRLCRECADVDLRQRFKALHRHVRGRADAGEL